MSAQPTCHCSLLTLSPQAVESTILSNAANVSSALQPSHTYSADLSPTQLAKYMKLDQKGCVLAEYIWIDGTNGLRNKTKVSSSSPQPSPISPQLKSGGQ